MEQLLHRKVTLTREAEGIYVATNAAGVQLRLGSMADDAFGPVELLLAALAACSGVDVDVMTSRRAEPEGFAIASEAEYIRGDEGNWLQNLVVTFDLKFPEGEDGDKARARIGAAMKAAHDKTCTVSKTLERGARVTLQEGTVEPNTGADAVAE